MQIRSLIGGLVGAVALALGAGCESQVGEEYEGEAILTLEGSVELGEGEAADQVPVLAFPTADFNAFVLVDARVEGEFPARFRMSVFDPPPANARAEADGTVTGFLTVVPKDHLSEIPNVTGVSNGTPNEDGTWTFTRDVCTSDNICLQQILSCTMVECPIVGERGSAIPAAEVKLYSEAGVGGGEHWLEMAESCDAQVQSYEALLKSAAGYYVVYTKEALAASAYGPLSAGYNVFKTVEPATDQAWIDSMVCERDMPGSTCPPGVSQQLVSPNEQLTLRIGYRQ
jgi:hypothetical protein